MLKNRIKFSPFRTLLYSSVEDKAPQYGDHSARKEREALVIEKIYLSRNIAYSLLPKRIPERHSWKIVVSVSQNIRYRRTLHFSSKNSRATFLDFLFSKWLFSTLSEEEFSIFLLHEESTSTDIFYSALRAAAEGIPKRIIFQRYLSYCKLFQKEVLYTHQRYKSLQGKVLCSLWEQKEELPIYIKYSGYVKHQNDHGTLRTNSIVAELLEAENLVENRISYYKFFSLPVSEWFPGGLLSLTEDPKDGETGEEFYTNFYNNKL